MDLYKVHLEDAEDVLDQTFSTMESEFMDFERQHREFLYELARKRHLLEESRALLSQATEIQHELEVKVETEKREKENKIKDMNTLKAAAKQFEEMRACNKDSFVEKIELDIAKKENEILKDQSRELHQENIKIRRELDDIQAKQNCQSAFQNDIFEQQNKIKSNISQFTKISKTMTAINEKLQNLEKSFEICSRLEQYAALAREEKQKALKKKDEVEQQLILEKAELSMLKELMEDLTSLPKTTNEDTEYWKHLAIEKESQLQIELKSITILTESLDLQVLNDLKSVQLQLQQNEKIKELEEALENEKLKHKDSITVETQTDYMEFKDAEPTINDEILEDDK